MAHRRLELELRLRPLRRMGLAVMLVLLTGVAAAAERGEAGPATRIRDAAAAPTSGPAGHALPLAAHWNAGPQSAGFGPDYQLAAIRRGRMLLPWVHLPIPDEAPPDMPWQDAVTSFARDGLPISFVSTQWDVLVERALRPPGTPTSAAPVKLSPDSPLDAWYAAGAAWGRHPWLKELQRLYPEPPLVLFVSNNEQPRVTWTGVRDRIRTSRGGAARPDDVDVRRSVGDAWIARYRELQRGFRDALVAPAWRRNARFVGYEAFGGSAVGRWDGWLEYSLHVPGRFEPWPLAWDGASVSYYLFDWDDTTDYRVWSPQVQAMNWVPMLRQALEANPEFWFELSTWDGQEDPPRRSKLEHYASVGQVFDPARYEGFVQFGMWLLRPRVVREFRGPVRARERYETYFDSVLDAVGKVHASPELEHFWRHGRLVGNPASQHPYQVSLPADWKAVDRWFLLESVANPPRPWRLDTPLAVYPLALETGQAPERRWLVYAFAPSAREAIEARVTLPGLGDVHARASRRGCFTVYAERSPARFLGC